MDTVGKYSCIIVALTNIFNNLCNHRLLFKQKITESTALLRIMKVSLEEVKDDCEGRKTASLAPD